jgi:hypothetical protein
MDSESTGQKHHRQKSPNAPAYNIQECLEDTRKILRVENQVPISRESIAEHLSLAAHSGPFNRKLSSLRQYGLLEPIGKDLRVSDLFLRIENALDDNDRRRALREAMGRPTIFQGLLGQFEGSGMPSDINLTNQLVLKYRFTKKNAETVAKAFLESCRFVGLSQGRFQSLPPPPPPPHQTHIESPPSTPPRQERSTWHDERLALQCRQEIPLGTNRRAVFEFPEDITPNELAKIVRILQALASPLE